MGWGGSREISDEEVLCGLWVLGKGEVYEVRDEGLCFGVFGDA